MELPWLAWAAEQFYRLPSACGSPDYGPPEPLNQDALGAWGRLL